MSAVTRNGVQRSEQEIVNWLKEGPRTLGWDAWTAYNRETANRALQQDHIDRLAADEVMPPVEGRVTIVENAAWEYLYACRFDAPTLSFEHSSLNHAEVTLSMRLMSGTQLTVEHRDAAPRKITKIEIFHPAQGPRLVGRAPVEHFEGTGTNPGRVGLDIAADPEGGMDYQFSFASTYQAQLKGGAFLLDGFATLPAEQRRCVVNVLDPAEGGALAPSVVRARGLRALDSASGDGALLLFMAAKGSPVGDLPDAGGDWIYPIPDGFHSTLVIANHALKSKVIEAGLKATSPDAAFEYDNPSSPDELTATKGTAPDMGVELTDVPPFAKLGYAIRPSLAGEPAGSGLFSVLRKEDRFHFRWRTSSFSSAVVPLFSTEGPTGTTAVDFAWDVSGAYAFVPSDAGGLALVADPKGARKWLRTIYRQGGALDAQHYARFPALSATVDEVLADQIEQCFESVAGAAVEQFRLEGVTYSGEQVMHFGSVHLPHDLAMFGDVSTAPDAFEVAPLDNVIVAGASLQLTTVPPQQGTTWRVEPVEGFDVAPGSITSAGLYKAPVAADFDGTCTMVRVTASSGEHVRSALVRVAKERVVINPKAFVVHTGGGKVRMSAGSIGAGELKWTLTSQTGASLELPPSSGDVLFDEGDRLYVPGSGDSGEFFSVDTIVVTEASGGGSATATALVVELPLMGLIRVRVDTGLPENQVQLEFDGGHGPVPEMDWKVQAGAGSITPTGIFTPDAGSAEGFAVITATLLVEGIVHLGNYLILPLPLIDLEELKRVLA